MSLDASAIAKALRDSARVDNDRLTMSLGVVTGLSGTNNRLVEYVPQAISGTALDTGAGMLARQRVGGASLKIGDIVVVLKLDKDAYVLGRAGGDGVMRIEWGTVPMGSGKLFGALDFNADDFSLIQEDAVGADADVDEVNVSIKTPVIISTRTGGAITATNNSTTTYVPLASESFTLPTAGLWTMEAVIVANFINNTAASGATLRFTSPGVSSATNAETATLNNMFAINMQVAASGLSGVQTVAVEYRARNGGTATGQRWSMIIIGWRQ